MKTRPTTLDVRAFILTRLKRYGGLTTRQLVDYAYVRWPHYGDNIHGYYQLISRVLPDLRAEKLISDVKKRCAHCGRALTRGSRNEMLTLRRA